MRPRAAEAQLWGAERFPGKAPESARPLSTTRRSSSPLSSPTRALRGRLRPPFPREYNGHALHRAPGVSPRASSQRFPSSTTHVRGAWPYSCGLLQRAEPLVGILEGGSHRTETNKTRIREKLLYVPPVSLLHVCILGQHKPQARSPGVPEHTGFGVSSKTSSLIGPPLS